MHYKRAALTAALFSFIFCFALAAAQGATSYNGNIMTAINQTSSYISMVNQSSYLVFYPNLTSAYSYLSMAQNESSINKSYAYSLLLKAKESAEAQEQRLDMYESLSVYTLAVISLLLASVLVLFMRPLQRRKSRKIRQLSKF